MTGEYVVKQGTNIFLVAIQSWHNTVVKLFGNMCQGHLREKSYVRKKRNITCRKIFVKTLFIVANHLNIQQQENTREIIIYLFDEYDIANMNWHE